jgi:DNA-binding transcriptional regulator GbsR (MarR family)
MEDIINRLDISSGAASQGLKLLRGLGAVKAVYFPGDRRDHFAADLELRFSTVFVREEMRPESNERLSRSSTWDRSSRRCLLRSGKRRVST